MKKINIPMGSVWIPNIGSFKDRVGKLRIVEKPLDPKVEVLYKNLAGWSFQTHRKAFLNWIGRTNACCVLVLEDRKL